jgi:CheY-like chemotaxis protein
MGRIAKPADDGPDEPDFHSLFSLQADTPAAGEEGEKDHPAAATATKRAPSKTILCLETQTEIQDALRKTLSHMGYRVLLVTDAERAAERYREAPVNAVIVDTDGIGHDAIEAINDMHEKAHEDEQPLLALVLLGHRQDSLREKLPVDDRLIVLSKPVKMKQVQEAIHKLLDAS